MTSEMQRALIDLSTTFDPDPTTIFRRVLQVLSDFYDGTMGMITLVEGDRIRYRENINPHPLLGRLPSLPLRYSYCQFALGPVCPLLIQDARADPQLKKHPGAFLGLTRYLGVPIFNPQGDVIGTLCFLDGRSDKLLGQADVEFLSLLAMRVSTELERERATEARVAQERAMVEQLRRTAEEKRRFMDTVIHDLRQPLAAMRTTLYLLRDEEGPTERAECLALLENRVSAMGCLLEELLEYAQIEAGEIPWHLEEVDLRALLTECLDGFAPEAASRKVSLQSDLDHGLGTCRTDRAKLAHVVGNLVSNAIKFSARASTARVRSRGRVCVRACEDGADAWRLEVEDDGTGVPGAELRHIFSEFYQGANARESETRAGYPRGRGLGLAIVQHLCSAMGATISVSSRPGKGTRFTLTIPREHPQITLPEKRCAP